MKVPRRFGHVPSAVPAARHFAAQALGQTPREAAETVELMVCGLATNCIRHTGSGGKTVWFTLSVAEAA